ncbi:MAG: DUF4342 domain-containing protein [Firmicutes bacterium]|nr:DUF4342 domain-containing protein [Bacillota bacterium]
MIDFEQVQKLREYADITYEEAKKALEETDGDLLQAVLNLEKQNKIKAPTGGGYYNSQEEEQGANGHCRKQAREKKRDQTNGSSFGEKVAAFLQWCGRIIHKGNINSFEVLKDDKRIMIFPVTVLVLLLLFAFWIVLPLLIAGLFCGYRYRFHGPDLDKPEVNEAMENVSKATVRAVDSVVNAVENIAKDGKTDKGESDGAHSDH